jgi:hypothetical protein
LRFIVAALAAVAAINPAISVEIKTWVFVI